MLHTDNCLELCLEALAQSEENSIESEAGPPNLLVFDAAPAIDVLESAYEIADNRSPLPWRLDGGATQEL